MKKKLSKLKIDASAFDKSDDDSDKEDGTSEKSSIPNVQPLLNVMDDDAKSVASDTSSVFSPSKRRRKMKDSISELESVHSLGYTLSPKIKTPGTPAKEVDFSLSQELSSTTTKDTSANIHDSQRSSPFKPKSSADKRFIKKRKSTGMMGF